MMLRGYERLAKRIDRLLTESKKLSDVLVKAAAIVANEAKRKAPVDTGRLRNSIFFKRRGMRDAVVGTNVVYARFVEFGHKAIIVPVRAKALRFYLRGGTGWVFAKRVVQGRSGRSAKWIKEGERIKYPFLLPALEASKEKIVDLFRKVIKQ